MLTFEFNEKDEILCIHGDPSGLKLLADKLHKLIETTNEECFDHTHLMTKEWGGDDLSSDPQDVMAKLINHAKLYCWKGEKPQT